MTLSLEPPLSSMSQMVHSIATVLVDFPENIEIKEVPGEQTMVIELKVDPKDVGKIVGRQGKMAHAIRTILNSASMKAKKRTILEIIG